MMQFTDDNCLRCPSCGGEWIHHERVEVFERKHEDSDDGLHVIVVGQEIGIDPHMKGNPSLRRDGISVTFWCEGCPNRSILTIAQHKGVTVVDHEIKSIFPKVPDYLGKAKAVLEKRQK